MSLRYDSGTMALLSEDEAIDKDDKGMASGQLSRAAYLLQLAGLCIGVQGMSNTNRMLPSYLAVSFMWA